MKIKMSYYLYYKFEYCLYRCVWRIPAWDKNWSHFWRRSTQHPSVGPVVQTQIHICTRSQQILRWSLYRTMWLSSALQVPRKVISDDQIFIINYKYIYQTKIYVCLVRLMFMLLLYCYHITRKPMLLQSVSTSWDGVWNHKQ